MKTLREALLWIRDEYSIRARGGAWEVAARMATHAENAAAALDELEALRVQRDELLAALDFVDEQVSANESEPDDVLANIGRHVRAAIAKVRGGR